MGVGGGGGGGSSVGFREFAFSLTYHHHDLLPKDNNNSNFMMAVSGCYQAQVDKRFTSLSFLTSLTL